MDNNETFPQNFNNKSVLTELNSTKISHLCLKIILSNQKSSDTQECLSVLKSYNRTVLIQLIRDFANYSLFKLTKDKFPFVNQWYIICIWCLIFGAMVLFAIAANSLIIWIIIKQKLLRTVFNIFLVNLTISDLLTITFNATFNVVFMLTGNWPFGLYYCVANNFINNLTIASSVFTIMVICVERYVNYIFYFIIVIFLQNTHFKFLL